MRGYVPPRIVMSNFGQYNTNPAPALPGNRGDFSSMMNRRIQTSIDLDASQSTVIEFSFKIV